MNSYFLLPLSFLKFWYFDSPRALFLFFGSLNRSFLKLFSLPLMIKTFFKPLKNEYREGLVRFSKVMGVLVKSVLITIYGFLFILVLVSEVLILSGFLAFPVLTILLLML